MAKKMIPSSIRIVEAAVGTGRIQGRTAAVMRGKIPSDFFSALTIPDYQRQVMEDRKADEIYEALGPEGTGVPDDILVCVRHDNYDAQGANEFVIPLTGDIVILDGHQRYAAAMERLAQGQKTDDFGIKIFFGTTVEEEILTFYQLNRKQTKVSTQVLLRNFGTNAAIEALIELEASDPSFPRIQWNQRKKAGEVITAHMLYEIAAILHGRPRGGEIENLLEWLDDVTDLVGTEILVENVRTFFKIVQKCFGEGKKEHGEIVANDKKKYMYRLPLLLALARVFAWHENFWAARQPYVLKPRAEDVRKLGTLPARTVERDIVRTNATSELIEDIIKYMNSQREGDKKLVHRDRSVWMPEEDADEN